MGLTVSAEEIIKDRKILKREAFLNLSWASYLLSKVGVLLVLSAIQAFSFVIIGNTIMEIHGMYFSYWLILFSCWVSANMIGLVISDSFKTVVTIYILIPFLVIPQIILSGVIVKYEKLNPLISSPDKIPGYGEIITARWGYEALAVQQFTENEYMKEFYHHNKIMSICEYKKNYWGINLENKVDFLAKYRNDKQYSEKTKAYIQLLANEIEKELYKNSYIKFKYLKELKQGEITNKVLDELSAYLRKVNRYYVLAYNKVNDEKDKIIRSHQANKELKEEFLERKRMYYNDKLAEFAENTNEAVRIVEYKGRLIQKIDPIYLDPESGFIKAHFYSPRKLMFGRYYSTFWVNTIVIWFMSLIFYIILYFRGLRYLLALFENVKIRNRET